jgi:hypothetical protein
MIITTNSARRIVVACSIIVLAGCGGKSTSQPDARVAAATATASTNAACTSITPAFYWEIGDVNGPLASGTGGANPGVAPNPAFGMSIASASKWLFSTYVVEKRNGVFLTGDIPSLNFESGYTNFNSCSSGSTVGSCLTETGRNGGTNGDLVPTTVGFFFYDSGHMQQLASAIGLGGDNNAALATEIKTIIGTGTPFGYSEPQLAGGVYTSPAYYAQFLRNMLGGTKYPHMSTLLGSHAVCTNPNSTPNGTDCLSAPIFSPVNQSAPGQLTNDVSDEHWHYSLGHWVEDDPGVGDGAFSSPGRSGFYPWIDKTKTYYGILARYDPLHVLPPNPAYITSVYCGRLIRKAWETGQQQ